ncbi:MAG: hypothetical protein AAGJ18_12500 [Bacteroidota bacterium]
MTKQRIIRATLILSTVLLETIQFLPIDKTNPPIDAVQDFMSATNPLSEVVGIL